MKIFQVGGSLRDEMLGLPVNDRDWVVVGSTPQEMIKLGYRPIGKDFPVFLHPQTHEEYALARTERKTSPGYHGFTFHADPSITLEQDLQRRDLTINAMARADDGSLIDPYHGQQDLQQRWLRHVSPAFNEDPVRLLRIARFHAKLAPFQFRIAPETQQRLKQMVLHGEIDALVPERVQQELDKGLSTSAPSLMFQHLLDWGALHKLFPNLPLNHFSLSLKALDISSQSSLPLAQRWVAWLATLLLDDPPDQRHSRLVPWATRYHWSRDQYRLITLACELGPIIRQQDPGTPETWLTILDQYDAWRRPERFLEALDLQECLSLIHHDNQPDLKMRGKSALARCQAIDRATIARTTPNPADIPKRLWEQRLQALKSN